MKKVLIIMIVALGMTSCKKFLQEYSQTDITPKTARDYGNLLWTEGYPGRTIFLQPWMAYLDDDVECYTGPVRQEPLPNVAAGIFQWQTDFERRLSGEGYAYKTNTWGVYYRLLLGVNLALNGLGTASGTQEEKELLKGQAYALRAFYHFMLVNIYAKPYNDSTTTPDKSPGVPIRTTGDLADVFLARHTVKEVYTQITNDIDSAVLLLDKYKKSVELYRISAPAAHLLASRIYLYMENWDKCIQHADAVLKERSGLMNFNTWGYADPDNRPLTGINNEETLFAYGEPDEQVNLPFTINYEVSRNLFNTFEDNDLRREISLVVLPPEMKQFVAIELGQMKTSGTYKTGNATLTNGWRVSEAYLNRAEAYIQRYKTGGDAGAATQALRSLNTLRSYRINTASFKAWDVKPAAEMLQMCREERRRELFREELHRWFDLRRYGMPAIEHIYRPNVTTTQIFRLEARDPMYVMPIPDDVLNRNPALLQNPLYPGERKPL
ncbi:RagB/SusD family nutrient uptake outer membrane protein [Chitinophaga oryzae]|uniref:RagB/SusD family nutrient uptake outer membrane protein n=1 Tax=Chitinophaga oryzae TaxID=2725414 RepID=A0AAE6ZFW0_9BACT|nr:RagB/SusD family nutrient uptake outer membrane protein [Chitinophaga oryzae]QJB31851.1 RagB/SusD family nutrient uptake outer membrane protein [Chitinophaga oryzae]QJB38329.1 RagB/SusD family nutrient uptake outer membrane protein [Chitinophaga oryzae]